MSMISSLMGAVNPSVQAAENRTLGLTASLPQAATTAGQTAAAVTAPAGTVDPAGAAAAGSQDASTQASLGAEMVQPPKPSKILIGSVLRGAVSGAGLMFGINSFGSKIPFVAKIMTKAAGLIGLRFPFPSVLVTLGIGAAVGGIFGLLGGIKKVRKAATDYATAQAAAAQQQAAAAAQAGAPVLDPAGAPAAPVPEPAAEPAAPPDASRAKKNPEMGPDYRAKAKRGAKAKATVTAHGKDGEYHIRSGDTLGALARKWGCSVQDIVKANPKITNPNLIYAGDWIAKP